VTYPRVMVCCAFFNVATTFTAVELVFSPFSSSNLYDG
jgi:hypothetical protein